MRRSTEGTDGDTAAPSGESGWASGCWGTQAYTLMIAAPSGIMLAPTVPASRPGGVSTADGPPPASLPNVPSRGGGTGSGPAPVPLPPGR
ncbi:MAG: hypothetical protein M3Y58_05660 [Chloroflexota bacterium]|nr:hypothetical protein [Chloroflexota bacterium]